MVRIWDALVNCIFYFAEKLSDRGELTDGHKNVVCIKPVSSGLTIFYSF